MTPELYTCIYVLKGEQVAQVERNRHPGMHSHRILEYEHKVDGKNVVFSWDHMDSRGRHVFVGSEYVTAGV